MARRMNVTKYEIIKVASDFFFSEGYSATSPKMVAEKLGISTGNITYYFPTKEHLLAVIVQMMCEFQWELISEEAERGIDSVSSVGIELMLVASACEHNRIAREFFAATFRSELCLGYLRKNHVERAKKIFAVQCEGWSDEDFVAAEILVMGLQYSTIITTDAEVPLEKRISGALKQIFGIYSIDEETAQREIKRILSINCDEISEQVIREFVGFVEESNVQTIEEATAGRSILNSLA